jgi:hypothetical protein
MRTGIRNLGLALVAVAFLLHLTIPIRMDSRPQGGFTILTQLLPLCFMVAAILLGILARQRSVFLAGIFGGLLLFFLPPPVVFIDREASPESGAVARVRALNVAEQAYAQSHDGKYGRLRDLVAARLIGDQFATGQVSQYVFAIEVDGNDYTITATPASLTAGRYGFFSKADGVIRYARQTGDTCRPCFPKDQSGVPVQ